MILLFFGELILLFLLSRMMTSQMSLLFHRILKSRKISIFLLAAIFLPGTIIHEFAHAAMAKILFVYVGKIELMPELHGESLKLGSVEVGEADIVRNFLIGIAPFVVGTSFLLAVFFYMYSNQILGFNLITILALFFAFVVSNTMYSSKKDMEGTVAFFLIVIAPIIFLYYIGVRIPGVSWEIFANSNVSDFFYTSSIFLGIPIAIDLLIILFAKVLTRR